MNNRTDKNIYGCMKDIKEQEIFAEVLRGVIEAKYKVLIENGTGRQQAYDSTFGVIDSTVDSLREKLGNNSSDIPSGKVEGESVWRRLSRNANIPVFKNFLRMLTVENS